MPVYSRKGQADFPGWLAVVAVGRGGASKGRRGLRKRGAARGSGMDVQVLEGEDAAVKGESEAEVFFLSGGCGWSLGGL